MQLGLFTPIFGKLSLDAMLVELKRYPQIKTLEIGTGAWPGSSHIDVEGLLANPSLAKEYLAKLENAGLSISAATLISALR
jgi:sugar phosphate isomerase/epimerase